MTGIDLSYANKVTDWDTVAKNVDFVILRAGYGKEYSQVDSNFEKYYAECKKRNIPVGCYWYNYAKNTVDAEKEAAVFLKTIQGKQFEYPVYYDVEEQTVFNLGKTTVSAIITKFCSIVEQSGYYTGFYSNPNFLHNVISKSVKNRFTLWLAHWDTSIPYCNYGVWQKSAAGKINGISGNVDIDECVTNFPHIIKTAGLNGFKKTDTQQPKNEIKVTVEIDGKTYHGTLKE